MPINVKFEDENQIEDVEFKNSEGPDLGTLRIFHVQVANSPTVEVLTKIATGVKDLLASKTPIEIMASAPDLQIFEYVVDRQEQPIDAVIVKGAIDIEVVARTCYTVNQQYVLSSGENGGLPWEQTTIDVRNSYMKAVNESLRYNYSPEEQHEKWLEAKAAEGWTYGPIKNEELKQSPAFLPYAALPPAQKVKDYMFKGVIASLKPQLPVPQESRKIEIVIDDFQNPFLSWSFTNLKPGLIFRFVGSTDEFVHRAVGLPYIDYLSPDGVPAYSIDIQTLNLSEVLDSIQTNREPLNLSGAAAEAEAEAASYDPKDYDPNDPGNWRDGEPCGSDVVPAQLGLEPEPEQMKAKEPKDKWKAKPKEKAKPKAKPKAKAEPTAKKAKSKK